MEKINNYNGNSKNNNSNDMVSNNKVEQHTFWVHMINNSNANENNINIWKWSRMAMIASMFRNDEQEKDATLFQEQLNIPWKMVKSELGRQYFNVLKMYFVIDP